MYHIKIIGIICDMVDNLGSQSTIIKTKIRNTFDVNYLLGILAGNDIYTHTGLQGQMRFLLKRQIMRIMLYILEKNDAANLISDNNDLLHLLDFYHRIFVERAKKGKDESLNEALYVPYFVEYKE